MKKKLLKISSGIPLDAPENASINSIQHLFDITKSGLKDVTFNLFPRLRLATFAMDIRHSAAQWIGRCCHRFKIGKLWLLSIMQKEQGLISCKSKLDPYYSYRTIGAPEKLSFNEVIAHGYIMPGERPLRTRGGWIAVSGQHKMWAACGYSIPDPGKPALFNTHKVIGFQRQIYEAARWTRARMDEFRTGKSTVKVGGIEYFCEDLVSYLGFRYTPHRKAQIEWHNVLRWIIKQCKR